MTLERTACGTAVMPSGMLTSRRRPSLREWPAYAGRGTSGPFGPSLNPRPGVLWAPPGCTYVQRGASVVLRGSYGPRRGGSKYAPLRLLFLDPHACTVIAYVGVRSYSRLIGEKSARARVRPDNRPRSRPQTRRLRRWPSGGAVGAHALRSRWRLLRRLNGGLVLLRLTARRVLGLKEQDIPLLGRQLAGEILLDAQHGRELTEERAIVKHL